MYCIIFITACIFDFILNQIKTLKLYHHGLNIIPYTRYNLVSNLENVLYKITTIGLKIPYLIYCPQPYKIETLYEQQLDAINMH